MIYLGLGSSIGNAESIFKKAEEFLASQGIQIVRKSSILKNPPLTKEAKNEFNNAVWGIELMEGFFKNWIPACAGMTELEQKEKAAKKLLEICKHAEANAGRDFTAPRWSDRPLDLDILMFEDLILNTPPSPPYEGGNHLILPHSEIPHRIFVLQPWAEIVDEAFIIPKFGSLRTLLEKSKEKF